MAITSFQLSWYHSGTQIMEILKIKILKNSVSLLFFHGDPGYLIHIMIPIQQATAITIAAREYPSHRSITMHPYHHVSPIPPSALKSGNTAIDRSRRKILLNRRLILNELSASRQTSRLMTRDTVMIVITPVNEVSRKAKNFGCHYYSQVDEGSQHTSIFEGEEGCDFIDHLFVQKLVEVLLLMEMGDGGGN